MKICFICPIYEPDFHWGLNLIESFCKFNLHEQSDLYFIFSSYEEAKKFPSSDCKSVKSIVVEDELRELKDRKGIVTAKKFIALQKLYTSYHYVIAIDCESEFLKSVDLLQICRRFHSSKILLGNFADHHLIPEIKNRSSSYLRKGNRVFLDDKLYLWFNNPCIYDSINVEDFFAKINYDMIKNNFNFYDFDYYIYMYYLIIYHGFFVVDMLKSSSCALCETCLGKNEPMISEAVRYNIYMCTHRSVDYFENPNLFMKFHLDRDPT